VSWESFVDIGFQILVAVRIVELIAANTGLIISTITLLVTAILVAVTWKYAQSTASIAEETRNAARAARDAAQISLLQSLLNVQPLLEVQSLSIDYYGPVVLASGMRVSIPAQVKCQVANLGRGVAFSPRAWLRIAGRQLEPTGDAVVPTHLDPAAELSVTYQVDAIAKDAIVASFGSKPDQTFGTLLLICHDAFGSLIQSEVRFYFDEQPRVGIIIRTYAGGPELRARLEVLLDNVLSPLE
jgi:hypothetical protein